MEEGLKEEEEEENHHQLEDEDVVEDGTQIEAEAEDIGPESLATLMTPEFRPILIIMRTAGAEMGASKLLEETNQTIRPTPSKAIINDRGNTEVLGAHTTPLEITWRRGFTRWASMAMRAV